MGSMDTTRSKLRSRDSIRFSIVITSKNAIRVYKNHYAYYSTIDGKDKGFW